MKIHGLIRLKREIVEKIAREILEKYDASTLTKQVPTQILKIVRSICSEQKANFEITPLGQIEGNQIKGKFTPPLVRESFRVPMA